MNRKEAQKYYKTWMKEKTVSPVLGEIKITNNGWDHLDKGSRKNRRNSKDKAHKFNLLHAAKYVIKNAKSCKITNNNKLAYYELTYKVKIRDNNKYKYASIKVILKKSGNNKITFFSVMKV